MTVIQPNSVAGINSITVQSGNSLAIHKSNGELLRTITGTTGVTTFSSISVGTAYTDNSAAKSINIGLGASISQPETNSLSLGTGGDERLRITSGGLVGIGTNSYNAPLTVVQNDNSGHIASFRQKNAGNSAQILIDSPTDNNIRPVSIDLAQAGTIKWSLGQAYAAQSDRAFHIATSALSVNDTNAKLTITTAGAVGISSLIPTSGFTLDVGGDVTVGTPKGVANTFIDQKQDGDLHLINSGRTSNGVSGNITGGTGGVGINKFNTRAGGTSLFRDFAVYNGKSTKVLVVDGSASAVGIGTDTPDGALTIAKASSTDMLMFNVPGSTGTFGKLGHNTASGTSIFDMRSEGHIRFLTGGNNERLKITSGGNALFGGTGVSQTNRQLVVGSDAEANFAIETHNTSASETANIRFYRSRGTAASPTTLVDGDVIAQQLFYAHDGTDYANTAASIKVQCSSTVASNSVPSIITFSTHDGSSTGERLRIQHGGGISFNGDSGTANALDDYEEGTFTPVLNNAGSFSSTAHTGMYTKVGRLVHYVIQISGTCSGTGSGTFTISGLPFNANNATGGHGQAGCMGALFRWNIPDTAYQIGIRVSDNTANLQFFANFDNANDSQLSSPFNAGTIFGSLAGSYFTAS